ncbi:hypothetical protein [Novosphingobium sp. MMS21-SN21R]|nr:hypothetical protein [Novosphingobium sp. MMS21-SN21R]MDT0509512.1 hypothetical protein [Novosphingobium sp. MMS21-SN21R]
MYAVDGEVWLELERDDDLCAYEQTPTETPLYPGASANNELVDAARAVLSELERRGHDGWMTGCVHGDDYDRLSALLTRVKGDDHGK